MPKCPGYVHRSRPFDSQPGPGIDLGTALEIWAAWLTWESPEHCFPELLSVTKASFARVHVAQVCLFFFLFNFQQVRVVCIDTICCISVPAELGQLGHICISAHSRKGARGAASRVRVSSGQLAGCVPDLHFGFLYLLILAQF